MLRRIQRFLAVPRGFCSRLPFASFAPSREIIFVRDGPTPCETPMTMEQRCRTRRSFLADTGMGFTGLALGAMLAREGAVRAGAMIRLAASRTEVPNAEMQASAPNAEFADIGPPLWDGLGTLSYKITTASAMMVATQPHMGSQLPSRIRRCGSMGSLSSGGRGSL